MRRTIVFKEGFDRKRSNGFGIYVVPWAVDYFFTIKRAIPSSFFFVLILVNGVPAQAVAGSQPTDQFGILLGACATGNLNELRSALETGVSPNQADLPTGVTPLMAAAQYGQRETMDELLRKGARTDAEDLKGETTLMKACFKGHLAISRILLEQDSNPNAQARQTGVTPLMAAAWSGSSELVRLLLHSGAKSDRVSKKMGTALHVACAAGHTTVVRMLMENGVDINLATQDHQLTPLMIAAAQGYLEVVKDLLRNGADPDRTDHKGRTALSLAKERGYGEVVSALQRNNVSSH